MVNRIFLLSDGLANVGPKSPAELGKLGSSLIQEGISVTTIGLGLGYNEDLMSELALRSDGSHSFAKEPAHLARIFDEDFGEALSVTAQDVKISIDCGEGVRPLRVLGRDADITGRSVTTRVNQLYSGEEEAIVVELEVSPGESGSVREIAAVGLNYLNMGSMQTDQLQRPVTARFSDSMAEVSEHHKREVAVSCISQMAVTISRQAMALRDAGKIEEARQLFITNSANLKRNAELYDSEVLKQYAENNAISANSLDPEKWVRERKQIRYEQSRVSRGRSAQPRVSPPAK